MILSGAEQLLLEMINRTRLDPAGEAARFGIDLNEGLAPGTLTAEARQVLAPNALLHTSAQNHADWMIETDTFSHTGVDGTSPGDRMADAGYVFAGSTASGENISYTGSTGPIDPDELMENDHHRNLFLSEGHRVNMLHDSYSEIGVSQQAGVFTSSGKNFNVSMVVENFALSGSNVFVTGVHYTEQDDDDFYSIGEGRGGVAVSAVGQTTQTQAAGGYALELVAASDVAITLGGVRLTVNLTEGNGKLDLVDGTDVATSVDTTLQSAAGSLTALGVGDIDLTGHAGADILIGNVGNNVLDGGAGIDSVRYDLAEAAATVTEQADGSYLVQSTQGTDTLRNIETLLFNDATVSLTLQPPPAPDLEFEGDLLVGDAGDDVLYAGGFAAGLAPDVSAQVYRLYQAALDRAPDTGGHEGWTQILFEGDSTLVNVAVGFVGSAEFQRAYGALNTVGFVDLLYNNVLGREADAAGRSSWVARIDDDGFSRAQTLVGFSESREFINNTDGAATQFTQARSAAGWSDDVYRLYSATFDRAPDRGGFDAWTENLANGTTFTQAVSGFVNSKEFQNAYGDLDNEAFVELLYNNVLDRSSDMAGQQSWLNALSIGSSRADVVKAFVQSGEFVRASVQDVHDWVTQQGVQDVLQAGAGENVLAGGALSDAFVFNAQTQGSNTVLDLEAWDVLRFEGFGYTAAADVRAQLVQQDDAVVFADQNVQVTFEETALTMLMDNMFLF